MGLTPPPSEGWGEDWETLFATSVLQPDSSVLIHARLSAYLNGIIVDGLFGRQFPLAAEALAKECPLARQLMGIFNNSIHQ